MTAIIALALIGGILPACLWLWLFLKADTGRPEPRLLILLAFIAGMFSVLLALVLQHYTQHLVSGPLRVILWAGIEEWVKFIMAAVTVLRSSYFDEPVDAVVYMVTVALGFSALETGLYLLAPLSGDALTESILLAQMRFLGASLLHVLASAAIGVGIGLAFCRSARDKALYFLGGLLAATALHSAFNFLIMEFNDGRIVYVFFLVWVGIVTLFLFFEKVKMVCRPLFIINNTPHDTAR